jgi:hypothetical protein
VRVQSRAGQGELIRADPALALPHLAMQHAPRAAMWVFSLCTGLSTSLMYSLAPLSLHLLGQRSPRVSARLLFRAEIGFDLLLLPVIPCLQVHAAFLSLCQPPPTPPPLLSPS